MSDLTRITLDGVEYGVEEGRTSEITASIRSAMESGLLVTLDLVNADGRDVTVYFNPKATSNVAIERGTRPRPTEISGSTRTRSDLDAS